MNQADELWDESDTMLAKWGLSDIPFSESAINLGQKQLHQVFTGRTAELRQVFPLMRGRTPKRIFVYGWIGIGKTAFVREVLDVVARKATKTLTAYIGRG